VTTNIDTEEKAIAAYHLAKKISGTIIVEEYIRGEDYRFLVINYKLVSVAKRTPALVVGDGKSTIAQLIEEENKNPERGVTAEHVLALIKVDAATKTILREKNLTLESILPAGEVLHVKSTANISAGGTSTDVTDLIHPKNKFLAERVARIFNLDICGVDIMATTVEQPLTRGTGAIIEVNAGPGLRMHTNPTHGTPRNVAKPIIDMLFPDGARIPIVAINSVADDRTIIHLIAHIAETAGKQVGYTYAGESNIRGHQVCSASATESAICVLSDTLVDFAVLECESDSSAPGFDHCDIAVITDDVFPAAQLTFDSGYAVLNADREKAFGMRDALNCNIALYSLSEENGHVNDHCKNGGAGARISNGKLVVCKGDSQAEYELPKQLEGNLNAVVLVATLNGFSEEKIRQALVSFGS
jgi:cyanophycin synthetase